MFRLELLLFLAVASVPTSCGGIANVSTTNDHSPCPEAIPSTGATCERAATCEYRTPGAPAYCTNLATCDGNPFDQTLRWSVSERDPRCASRPAYCPASYTAATATTCGAASWAPCFYDEGKCGCTESICSPGFPPFWDCHPWSIGCPTGHPLIGSACPTEGEQCGDDCADVDGPLMCREGLWSQYRESEPCAISCPVQ